MFRFRFPLCVPVPAPGSRSGTGFPFPFPFRVPVPMRRCANPPMRSCAHADEPIGHWVDGLMRRWDSKRGPNLNFYAICNLPKRGEIWAKIELLRDLAKGGIFIELG